MAIVGDLVPARYQAMIGISFVLALRLKEKPLSPEMVEVAEGRIDVPEY